MLGIMRRTRTDRTWATVVALALLLHTFVAGIVGGALAAPSHAGVFGIICSAHRESDPPRRSRAPLAHARVLPGRVSCGGRACCAFGARRPAAAFSHRPPRRICAGLRRRRVCDASFSVQPPGSAACRLRLRPCLSRQTGEASIYSHRQARSFHAWNGARPLERSNSCLRDLYSHCAPHAQAS